MLHSHHSPDTGLGLRWIIALLVIATGTISFCIRQEYCIEQQSSFLMAMGKSGVYKEIRNEK